MDLTEKLFLSFLNLNSTIQAKPQRSGIALTLSIISLRNAPNAFLSMTDYSMLF